ncbi:MAG: hypothetical protein R3F37_13420 [Candidatus Competibacteraceae bacterium]
MSKRPLRPAEQEQYEINRYSLPDAIESFVQIISWVKRVNEFDKLSLVNYINTLYGSKKGLILTFQATINYQCGKYQDYQKVDWSRVKRLVFICTGNVCRSPFAQVVAQQCGFPATSYGLNTDHGTQVNPIASRIALRLGVDMTEHQTRALNVEEFEDGDLIIGMEPSHCERHWYTGIRADVQFALLGLLTPGSKKPYLHDPYGLSDGYYYRCLSYIQRVVNDIEISNQS